MSEQQSKPGFTHTVAKKALGPLVASAATATTAFLMRKGSELWEERLQPLIDEKGGGKAAATDALERLRRRVPDNPTEKLAAAKSKLTGDGEPGEAAASDDGDREDERRKREQRRKQRRRALEKAS